MTAESVFFFTDTSGYGGAEKALFTLMEGLDRHRWQPVLVHHPEPGIAPLLEDAHRIDVPLWQVPRMPEGREGALRVPTFARQLSVRRPAVFHAHLTWPRACKFGLAAAILARVPAIVATLHLFVDLPVTRYVYVQQRLLASRIDCFVTVSGALARQLCAAYGTPAHKIRVIHNAVPFASFEGPVPSDLSSILGGASRRPIIFTAARLEPQKGLGYLLEAAALVPEAFFVLAGDGSEREALEEKAQALGLGGRMVFLGHRADVPELLAASDLFVLPSLYEGLPVSVLEAMASAKPVIAAAIPGNDEAVVDGETGFLVPPRDPAALALAISGLLSDRNLAERMGRAGRVRAKRDFSVETMVGRVAGVYDELLQARRGMRTPAAT
ncbi:MAG: glycosyltransferase family 4 protein [Chloroflexi bacterium]|nr:glycosyltransferase family 4 protein [Chloroflexota bacterium]